MNLNFPSASFNLTRRDKRKAKGKMHELSPKGGSTRLQRRRQTTAPVHHRRRTRSKETQSLLGYRTEWRPDVSSQEMKNWIKSSAGGITSSSSGHATQQSGGDVKGIHPTLPELGNRGWSTEGDRGSPLQQAKQQGSESIISSQRLGRGLSSGPYEPESGSKKRTSKYHLWDTRLSSLELEKRSSKSVSLNTAITPNGGEKLYRNLERQTPKNRTGTSQAKKGRRKQWRYTILSGGARSDLTQICSDWCEGLRSKAP